MKRVSELTDDQKATLKLIVGDFGGPTSTYYVLSIMNKILENFKPDWQGDPMSEIPGLHDEIEVCMMALAYADLSELG